MALHRTAQGRERRQDARRSTQMPRRRTEVFCAGEEPRQRKRSCGCRARLMLGRPSEGLVARPAGACPCGPVAWATGGHLALSRLRSQHRTTRDVAFPPRARGRRRQPGPSPGAVCDRLQVGFSRMSFGASLSLIVAEIYEKWQGRESITIGTGKTNCPRAH